MSDFAHLIEKVQTAHIAEAEKRRVFDRIVRQFQDMAFGYAFSLLGDFQLAQDAAQEAFVAAWRHLDQLQTPDAFPGWLKRIVFTYCHRITRKPQPDMVALEAIGDLPDETTDLFAVLARQETHSQVYDAMLCLPPHERLVTTLFYISDHSQQEIAAFLELPLTTIKKRLFSARKKMKESLLAMIQDTLREKRPSRNEDFANTVAVYNSALESFVHRVKQDRNILAVLLFGSLSYDTVWKKSDIDIILISRNERQQVTSLALVENGINIHAVVYPRNQFKRAIEGTLQNSFFHSCFAKSVLLYTTDETIREYYENVDHLGAHDRDMQLMEWTGGLLYTLTKAEKWHYVKQDEEYSFLWIMYSVTNLAKIETLLHNRLTSREVIQQALKLNPALFRIVYTDLIHGPKNAAAIENALCTIHAYLEQHEPTLFSPLLRYLAESEMVRTTSEIVRYFQQHVKDDWCILMMCEWLADKGVLSRVPSPMRLTDRSPIAVVDEAAYYYDPQNRLTP